MSGLVVGLDLEHVDERQADHDLLRLVRGLPSGTVHAAATHWARSADRPHVALSVELVDTDAELLLGRLSPLGPRWSMALPDESYGDAELHGAADAARQAHAERRSGRAVHFPGVEALIGTLTAQQLLQRSAVDRVQVLTAGEASSETPILTRGHIRPNWVNGELVLLTQAAVGGTLVPFESPTPTACCADH